MFIKIYAFHSDKQIFSKIDFFYSRPQKQIFFHSLTDQGWLDMIYYWLVLTKTLFYFCMELIGLLSYSKFFVIYMS